MSPSHPILPALLTLLLASCSSQLTPTRRIPHVVMPVDGRLVVVGGGGTSPEIAARILELAGGPDASIVILPQASESEERTRSALELWSEAGARNVLSLDPLVQRDAETAIETAALIWLPGGDQNRLMESLDEARVVDDIQRRFRQGAIVAGTSAGAAAMSSFMITGEASLESVRAGATVLAPGLGVWPEVIVDQHFVRRQRWARLVSAVLDHPEFVGVGIDERTAVEVHGRDWRVLGEGTVVVVDARRAECTQVEPGERQAARGMQMAILRAGDAFSLR